MLATAYNIPGSLSHSQTLTGEGFTVPGGQPNNYQMTFTQPLSATNLNSVVDPSSYLTGLPTTGQSIVGQFTVMPIVSQATLPWGNIASTAAGLGTLGSAFNTGTQGFVGFGGGLSNPLSGQFTIPALTGGAIAGGISPVATPFGQNFFASPAQQLLGGSLGFGGTTPASIRHIDSAFEVIVEVIAPASDLRTSEVVVIGNELRIRTSAQRNGLDLSRPFYSVLLPQGTDISRIQTSIAPNGILNIRIPRTSAFLGNPNGIRVA